MRDGKMALLAIQRELSTTPKTARDFIEILDRKYDLQIERKTVYANLNAITLFEDVRICKKGYYLGENK